MAGKKQDQPPSQRMLEEAFKNIDYGIE